LVTVYEARNPDLREIYLGTTTFLSERLVAEFAAHPPNPIRHWKPEHLADVRCIVYAIPGAEARGFIRKYSRDRRRRSWRVLRS
jgi:hypothetical protein